MTNAEGTQLLQSFSEAVAKLAEDVSASVVNVNSGRRSGSGVVWNAEGNVVTASHVVGRASTATVTFGDGRELPAKVVGTDQYSDVALLKVDGTGFNPIRAGSATDLRVGQFVLALANGSGRKASATSGIVTTPGRSMRGWWGAVIEDAVVSDAKLNPGYSGGPLVDASGKMVGMNVAYFAGRGIAVSVDSLNVVAEKLSKEGRVKKGYLGVVVEPVELPEDLAGRPEVGQGNGLLVRAVEGSSPAKAAGVALGDVLLRLGDTKATDEYELHRVLSGDVVGRKVSLWVLRGEKPTELSITPREAEE
jgi:serine protease DegQ